MDPIIRNYSGEKEEKTKQTKTPPPQKKKTHTKEQQLFSETRNGNIRSSGKPSNPKVEEGYCYKVTQSGPLTHSQSHQAQNTVEHKEVKQRRAWTKEEIRDVIWYYMYCRQHFTENYKKM